MSSHWHFFLYQQQVVCFNGHAQRVAYTWHFSPHQSSHQNSTYLNRLSTDIQIPDSRLTLVFVHLIDLITGIMSFEILIEVPSEKSPFVSKQDDGETDVGLSLSFSLSLLRIWQLLDHTRRKHCPVCLRQMIKRKKNICSCWLDCRHGSVFQAAHPLDFINRAGWVVVAAARRL